MKMKKRTNAQQNVWNKDTMFGANMSFAASEAYKLLRTNILFSFADGKCHVLGVTSAISGEGKSLTACNLASSLAEAGKKVLLLDGDLRLPTVASKLELPREPGLTNLLISHADPRSAIHHCSDAAGLDVLTAGAPAPNPSELLGSGRMEELLEQLARDYEYIIMDLPPVTVVSDALVVSRLLHGVVMVVRDGVVEERLLADAMRQVKMVGLRVLGFVYNCSTVGSGKYYRSYYKHYGERKGKDREKKA